MVYVLIFKLYLYFLYFLLYLLTFFLLIGRNPCLDQVIQTRKFKGKFKHGKLLFYKTITLLFPCLDGLIQTLGNVARVKKSAQNHSPSARVSRAFLNSRNIPPGLDKAIQTRKP